MTTPTYQPPNLNVPKFNNVNEICQDQVKKITISTKSKSCELDPIPITLLKSVLTTVLTAITKIINLSLQSGLFPRKWKTTVVTPLLKKQAMDLVMSSYRPVSNLPYLSKLVEKAMLAQINSHCNTNNLLHDYQLAYRENRSCKTVLLKLVNNLLRAMERKNVASLIALDLSPVFDTADHGILLSTLNDNFSIDGYSTGMGQHLPLHLGT